VRTGEYKLPALPIKERSPDLPHLDIGRDRGIYIENLFNILISGKYMGWQYGIEHTSEWMKKHIVDQMYNLSLNLLSYNLSHSTEASQTANKKMFDSIKGIFLTSHFSK